MKADNQHTYSGHDVARTSMNDLNDLYSKPETRKNIVDVILMIMDQDHGPKPMRNLRPTQKQRNGAEQFNVEHQEQYEARGRQPDKVTRVNQHNNAYPKLRDELDKRKSMTKATAIDSKPMPYKESHHAKCKGRKSKRLRVLKKSKLRPRCRGNSVYPMRQDSRVTKPKSRSGPRTSFSCPYKMYELSKISVHKSCQHSKHLKNVTTSNVSFKLISEPSGRNIASILMAGAPTKMYEIDQDEEINGTHPITVENSESSRESNRKESGSNNDFDSRNPDTSHPSLSSYNSYMSMDHEPMVAP